MKQKNFHIPWTFFTLKLVAKFECHEQEFQSSTATLLVIFTPEYKLNGHDERVHIPFSFIDDDSH